MGESMSLQDSIRGAITEASDLAIRFADGRPPVDIVKLAKKLGVAEVSAAAISSDGYLGRRADGRFVIRYSDASPHHRRRFTIAHEIGHLLLSHSLGEPIGEKNRSLA